MNKEVELKFLVTNDVYPYLETLFATFQILDKQDHYLKNSYFDTSDQALRGFDCGLRVRHYPNRAEQTVKLSGSDMAGLSQRPEFTLPIEGDRPDLYRFASDIWPEGFQVSAIQPNLIQLFKTDFHRRTWLVELESGTQIEIAYDVGFIEANGQQEPINEVELELVSGPVDALFQLSEQLIQADGWQLGGSSKAKRGYHLAGLVPQPDVRRMGFVPLRPDFTAYEALKSVMTYSLKHWQFHEQLYMLQPSLSALQQLKNACSLILYAQVLFKDVLKEITPTEWKDSLVNVLTYFRWVDEALLLHRMQFEYRQTLKHIPCPDKLNQLIHDHQRLLPDISETKEYFRSGVYCKTVLGFMRWLTLHEIKDPHSAALQESVARLADRSLENSWKELLTITKISDPFNHQSYQELRSMLRRNLQVGVCFATLYDSDPVQGFRLPWLNLLGRLSDLEHIEWIFDAMNQMNCPDSEAIREWLVAQLSPRLVELDQIRQRGIGMKPYWQLAPLAP